MIHFFVQFKAFTPCFIGVELLLYSKQTTQPIVTVVVELSSLQRTSIQTFIFNSTSAVLSCNHSYQCSTQSIQCKILLTSLS